MRTERRTASRYLDATGTVHPTAHLTDYQGCGHPDPDHSYEGGRIEYNNGACDGWLLAGQNDDYAIGYYTASDLAFLGQAAPAWATCDNYFIASAGANLSEPHLSACRPNGPAG